MSRPLPWRLVDLQVAIVLLGVGGLTASAGWWGASHTPTVPHQVPWAGLAVAGLVVGQFGMAWVVVAGRLALRRRHGAMAAHPGLATATETASSLSDAMVVASERMTRYHRPACPAVAGKAVVAAPLDAHRRAGRRPCDLCRP
jgi:hypothetical protein